MKKLSKNQKGFTLIELIVVIAILGILAAVMIPRLGGFQDSAKASNDEQAVAIIANAAAMYVARHPNTADGAIDKADLVTEGLINSSDASYTPESKKYSGQTISVSLSSGEVTATMGTYIVKK